MQDLLHFIYGLFQISFGTWFGEFFLVGIITIICYRLAAPNTKYLDMLEHWYVDSDTYNYEGKNFFEKHYISADYKRQNQKYFQAQEENINMFDIEFRKKISLPCFSLMCFFNVYAFSKNVICLVLQGNCITIPADEFGIILGYIFINLYLGFSFFYTKKLYANFITRGYQLSSQLPSALCTANILMLFLTNSYLNTYHPYYMYFIITQSLFCAIYIFSSFGNNYTHLFMDKQNHYYSNRTPLGHYKS